MTTTEQRAQLIARIDRELQGAPGSPDNRRTMLAEARAMLAASPPTTGGDVTQGDREAAAKVERLSGYPTYLEDTEGLARFRAVVLEASDRHDMAPVNLNSLARLLDTIEVLRALPVAQAGRVDANLADRLADAIEIPQEAISRLNRDYLGSLVRQSWVKWAENHPSPKPTWLVPYDLLDEPDKEVDRQIGVDLARIGASTFANEHRFLFREVLAALSPPSADGEEGEIVAWLRRQSELGANRGNDAPKGSTKRAAFGGGSLALSRAADAIESGDYRTNDNTPDDILRALGNSGQVA